MRGRRIRTREVNSLDSVVQASVDEGIEPLVQYPVHPFNENGVLCLEEFVTWIGPLLDRLFDEPSGDDEWVVVRELSCLCPALDFSCRTAQGCRRHSLQCHVHDLVYIDGTVIQAWFRFLRREKCGWFVGHLLPGFVRPKVRSGLLDSILEFHMERPNRLVYPTFVGCTLHESG